MSHELHVADDRLDRALDVPMGLLALVMIAIIVVQLVGVLNPPYDRWADDAGLLIWSAFVVEFLVKLWRAPCRRCYLAAQWLDVVILLLPAVRVLRWARVLRLGRGFTGLRFSAWVFKGQAQFQALVRQSHLGYLLAVTVVVTLSAAVLVWLLEQQVPGSPVARFGDALWWSATLMTTVNAGIDPVTAGGRVVAVLVRLYATGVFVYLVSALTTYWFARPQAQTVEPEVAAADEERPAA